MGCYTLWVARSTFAKGPNLVRKRSKKSQIPWHRTKKSPTIFLNLSAVTKSYEPILSNLSNGNIPQSQLEFNSKTSNPTNTCTFDNTRYQINNSKFGNITVLTATSSFLLFSWFMLCESGPTTVILMNLLSYYLKNSGSQQNFVIENLQNLGILWKSANN